MVEAVMVDPRLEDGKDGEREGEPGSEQVWQQALDRERLSAIGRMAAGIAHDLNNSLAPVVGFSELLLSGAEPLTERQREWLRLVHTGALDAARTVARLREAYRPRGAGDDCDTIDLARLVEQVAVVTRPTWKDDAQASGRSIDVVTDLAPVPVVSGSETELGEALTKLLFNAVDALPEGGTITLRTRTDNGCAVVEVADDGLGMLDEDRKRCLEPFFTTKGPRSAGLGLAVVHGTVERHGGHIEIESAPRVGTMFRLILPPAAQSAATDVADAREDDGAARKTRPLRVLLADDADAVRAVITACLEVDGHEVDAVDSPAIAIRLIGTGGAYDLVITDRAMPGLPGEALAGWIKRRRPDLPVIMVTGYGDLMNAAGERPAGVDAVLAKPVTLDTLRRAMEQTLSRAASAA